MNSLTSSLMLFFTLWAAAAAAGDEEADGNIGPDEHIEPDEYIGARLLAGSCYGCHGATGGQPSGRPGDQPSAMPDLSHLSVEEISARLKDYQQRNRPATVMSRIASGYSDLEIEQLANYFGRAPP